MNSSDKSVFPKVTLMLSDKDESELDEPLMPHNSNELLSAAAHHLMNTTTVTWADTNASSCRLRTMIRATELADKSIVRGEPAKGYEIIEDSLEKSDRAFGLSTFTNKWAFTGVSALIFVGLFSFLVNPSLFDGLTNTAGRTISSNIITTTAGQRSRVELPDGSVALLGPMSRIQYSTDFGKRERIIALEGEALFTVTNHTTAPFTVNAGPSATRVLGTSFVVRHYKTDTAAIIAVRDGKVVVGSVVLAADQEAIVGDDGIPQVGTAGSQRFSLETGILKISSVLLPDAIPELNRWYDADIRLGDSELATQRIYGVYRAGSITDLTSILELTFNVRVVREGRVLTLYRQQ